MLAKQSIEDICREEADRIIAIHPRAVSKTGRNELHISIQNYCDELNTWWEASRSN